MINIDELRFLQAKFEGERRDFHKDMRLMDNLRKKFCKDFPMKKLQTLTLDRYIQGKGDTNTFTYRIERELAVLGSMRNYSSPYYGIYYNQGIQNFCYSIKFKSPEEALKDILDKIHSLLTSGQIKQIDEIRSINIPPVYKGKLLSVYFPEEYLNIFSRDHLNYFLNKLEIPYTKNDDEIEKRILLLGFKNNDAVMRGWRMYEFTKFLYSSFGRPLKQDELKQIDPTLLPSIPIDLPFPDLAKQEIYVVSIEPTAFNQNQYDEDIENEEIASDIIQTPTQKHICKVDFLRLKKIGDRGEELVVKAERAKHIANEELAKRIHRVSLENDSLGYDILSFDENGNEMYIEVKTTTGNNLREFKFNISQNQINVAIANHNNYYLCFVWDVESRKPKLRMVKYSDIKDFLNLQVSHYVGRLQFQAEG